MNINSFISVLNSDWMINESSLHAYADVAKIFMASDKKKIGFFSEILLPKVPGNIAMITISGVLMKADIFGETGTRSLVELINQAAANPSKESIILYWESVPGGQLDGTQVFADAIKDAAQHKPVLSAISGMCCGAGVWGLSQSSEIYATSDTDQIGGIGLIMKLRNPESKNSDTIEVISDLSPDKNKEFKDTQILKDMYLNPVVSLFQNDVRAGRGDKLKEGDKVLTGGTFIASEAKKRGLIDGVMPFERIVLRANYLSMRQTKI